MSDCFIHFDNAFINIRYIRKIIAEKSTTGTDIAGRHRLWPAHITIHQYPVDQVNTVTFESDSAAEEACKKLLADIENCRTKK